MRQGNICQPYLLFQRTHLYPVTTEAVPNVGLHSTDSMLSNSDLENHPINSERAFYLRNIQGTMMQDHDVIPLKQI